MFYFLEYNPPEKSLRTFTEWPWNEGVSSGAVPGPRRSRNLGCAPYAYFLTEKIAEINTELSLLWTFFNYPHLFPYSEKNISLGLPFAVWIFLKGNCFLWQAFVCIYAFHFRDLCSTLTCAPGFLVMSEGFVMAFILRACLSSSEAGSLLKLAGPSHYQFPCVNNQCANRSLGACKPVSSSCNRSGRSL